MWVQWRQFTSYRVFEKGRQKFNPLKKNRSLRSQSLIPTYIIYTYSLLQYIHIFSTFWRRKKYIQSFPHFNWRGGESDPTRSNLWPPTETYKLIPLTTKICFIRRRFSLRFRHDRRRPPATGRDFVKTGPRLQRDLCVRGHYYGAAIVQVSRQQLHCTLRKKNW